MSEQICSYSFEFYFAKQLALLEELMSRRFTLLLLLLAFHALSTHSSVKYDFDGDSKADPSVFRPSNGTWYILNSLNGGARIQQFGLAGDVPVAADYDGDGLSDVAVYRAGIWYRFRSSTATVDISNFGIVTDTPIPADFDGDARADVAVFRPSNGTWHYLRSTNGSYAALNFGLNGDVPLPNDYDGDGKADINIFRPSSGTWYRINSLNGSIFIGNYGLNGDIPLSGDFDGDARADLAVWRPSTGYWYVQGSTSTSMILPFGTQGDIPVPANYFDSPATDIAVYRPSNGTWYFLRANGTLSAVQFGINTDVPVESPSPGEQPVPPPTSFTCDYYASPTGSASGSGTLASPWNLFAALGKTAQVRDGRTLCLRGGTYTGKFISTLNGGGIVRSAPGEWAVIDGYSATALTSAITSTQSSFTVTDGSRIFPVGGSDEITIDGEVLKFCSKSGNTLTGCFRAASGTIGGAVAHAAGASVIQSGSQLNVNGANTTYRDFEIRNSLPSRNADLVPEITRGAGVVNTGDGNSFINLIIHDNVNGVFTSSASRNTFLYGIISYNNGIAGNNSGLLGHGYYLENAAGYSRVYESMSLNSFNLGMQGYGVTGPYVGGDVRGSVFANSGAPGESLWPNIRNFNMVYGPDLQPSPTANVVESHFYHPPGIGYSVSFGYGAGIGTGVFKDNFFTGGTNGFSIGRVTTLTFTGNSFYSLSNSTTYLISPIIPYTWNNNTYHNANGLNRFGYLTGSGGEVAQFAAWRTITGFDANSTATGSARPTNVVVRPNSHQTGRANVIVYASSGVTSATVNLSTTGLVNGQQYTIRNAMDYFGAPIATGTYSTANPSVSVTLTGPAQSVAAPVGHGYTPGTTCPQFCPMVVVPN